MGKKFDFDYIVIGSGPAGATTALALAKAKKEVAIVEGESFGGSAVNSRDVPYGISLDFAHTFSKLSNSPETSTQDAHFNFPTIVSHSEGISSILSDEYVGFGLVGSFRITCASVTDCSGDHSTLKRGTVVF